jgi:hypothetical protein
MQKITKNSCNNFELSKPSPLNSGDFHCIPLPSIVQNHPPAACVLDGHSLTWFKPKNIYRRSSMVNHFNEKNRRDLGIVWLIAGLIFLFSGFSGGTIFLLLGILWLASSNGKGLALFRNNPKDMRSLLKGTTIGLLLIASVVLVVNSIR